MSRSQFRTMLMILGTLAMSLAAFADAPTSQHAALRSIGTEIPAMSDSDHASSDGSPTGSGASNPGTPKTSSAATESGAYALGGAFLLTLAAGDQRRRRDRRS